VFNIVNGQVIAHFLIPTDFFHIADQHMKKK